MPSEDSHNVHLPKVMQMKKMRYQKCDKCGMIMAEQNTSSENSVKISPDKNMVAFWGEDLVILVCLRINILVQIHV